MHLVRFNPIRDIFSLRNRNNNIFDDLFYPNRRGDEKLTMWNWKPVVDIYDNEDKFVINA